MLQDTSVLSVGCRTELESRVSLLCDDCMLRMSFVFYFSSSTSKNSSFLIFILTY